MNTPVRESDASLGPFDHESARLDEVRRFVALTPTEKFRLLVSALELVRSANQVPSVVKPAVPPDIRV